MIWKYCKIIFILIYNCNQNLCFASALTESRKTFFCKLLMDSQKCPPKSMLVRIGECGFLPNLGSECKNKVNLSPKGPFPTIMASFTCTSVAGKLTGKMERFQSYHSFR